MRARSQRNRWEEELPRTEQEMVWATLYFMHQRDIWYARLVELHAKPVRLKGHEAYCEEKIAHWEEFARVGNLHESLPFSSVQPTQIIRRCGGLFSLRPNLILSILMYVRSHVFFLILIVF